MTGFKYETHLHTSETSKCGDSSGAELADYYHARGYTGVFVTDHFLNGNHTVPPDLPWPQRVALFCRGYEETAQRGASIGLEVFFAWEYSYGWAHFLTYGLDQKWLLAHPEVLDWDVLEYFDRVRADGGFVVHAHPFREKIDHVHLMPTKIDAVEVINAGRADEFNRHALDFANSFGLPKTAGSDIHTITTPRLCGVVTPRRLAGGADYAAAVTSGDIALFDETPD